MPATLTGDMSQFYQSLRQSSAIKTRLNTLAQELSSGRVADVSTRVRGDVAPLALMDRDLSVLDGFIQTGTELARTLSQKQIVLSALEAEQTSLGAQLIKITPSASLPELQSAEAAGRAGFDRAVGLLNTRIGERSLFAGASVDATPLAAADTMIADILAAIGGATDAQTISAAIDDWFDDPAGGFATMGYGGDTGAVVAQRIGPTEVVHVDGRADDPGLRGVLKATARAAVSDALSEIIGKAERTALVREGGDMTISAADGLRQVAARIGDAEQRIEEITTRHFAQRTAIAQSRNGIVVADPFDTASLLQSVQQQLELHYTATARLSRMSLASYL